MTSIFSNALLPAAVAALALGTSGWPLALPLGGRRKARVQSLATLLRSPDAALRIQALERANALPPRDRAALSRMLHREAEGGTAPAMTVWFVRQLLALLNDTRVPLRMDAARVLRCAIGAAPRGGAQEDWTPLSPAVAAAVELTEPKGIAGLRSGQAATRSLALAEILESGLPTLALGLQTFQEAGEEALDALAAAARDRNPRVRRSLCEVVAAFGGEQAIAVLTQLLQDPVPDLRARAAQALSLLQAVSAGPALTELLADPVSDVRAAAAAAVATLGLTSAVLPLLDALAKECRYEGGTESTRTALAEAVARLSDGSRPELLQALTDLPRPVASRLAVAMERHGVVDACLVEPDYPEWGDMFGAFLAATAALGVSQPFLEAVDATDDWVRRRATAALGHGRSPEAFGAVRGLLGDPDPGVRAEAVSALARLGDPRALAPLAIAAADPDQPVRLSAVRGLRHVLAVRADWRLDALPADLDLAGGTREAERALLRAAVDLHETVRLEAASALGQCRSAEAAEALVNLALSDTADAVRQAAAEALPQSESPQLRRLLSVALEDQDESRRAHVMTLLGSLRGTEAGRYLLDALRDPSALVRESALLALSRLDPASLKSRLATELRNPDPRVRAGTAALLGKARASEHVSELVAALSDPEEQVRVNVLNALAHLGAPVRRYQHDVSARLSDPSARVREVAEVVLEALRQTWAESSDGGESARAGGLSDTGAAAVLEAAAEGDLDPLLRALDEPRASATFAAYLSRQGVAELSTLLASLSQYSEGEQARATAALGRALREHGSGTNYLIGLVAIDPAARLAAIDIAGLLATPQAVEALVDVLASDPVSEVRSRAAVALSRSAAESAQAALRRAHLHDPSTIVKLAASQALNQNRTAADMEL